MTETIESTTPATPLGRLSDILPHLGYANELSPKGQDGAHFDTLLVILDETEASETYQYVAQLFFTEDILKTEEIPDIQDELENSACLQFLIDLPVDFSGLGTHRMLDAMRLVNYFSQLVPVGAFGVNQENKVYFNYALMAEDQNLSSILIAEILGMLGFFINRLSPMLQDCVTTETPLAELIKQTETLIADSVQQFKDA